MPVLIDNYTQVETPPPTISYTVQSVRRAGVSAYSTVFSFKDDPVFALNERALRLLDEFKMLPENWDEDGAKAPSRKAIQMAESLVLLLQQTGQKVYHVAPGPQGDVMVDLRENGESVEILFYPDKMRYVYFPQEGNPEQGEYQPDLLPQILEWLHA